MSRRRRLGNLGEKWTTALLEGAQEATDEVQYD